MSTISTRSSQCFLKSNINKEPCYLGLQAVCFRRHNAIVFRIFDLYDSQCFIKRLFRKIAAALSNNLGAIQLVAIDFLLVE